MTAEWTYASVFDDDAPAGNVTPGPWPAAPADSVHAHVAMVHRLAASCDGKLIVASYGYNPDSRQAITPKVRQFVIGDVEGMTAAVRELASEKFRNVYVPMCVMRADLPDRKKGSEADIVAVLGSVGDFDDDRASDYPARLPLAANYALETSTERFQPFHLFTKPLPMAEAKALGVRMQLHTGCDYGTEDVSHVWRVPGTLNWPGKAKLEKGRSPEPQQVRVAQPWDGSLTDPAALDRVLPPLPVAPAAEIVTSAEPIDLHSLPRDLRIVIMNGPPEGKDRSGPFHAVVTSLTEAGHSVDAIHDVLAQHPAGIAAKYEGRLRKAVADSAKKASRKSAQEDFGTVRPTISCARDERTIRFRISA
jgi:hypothetical protein